MNLEQRIFSTSYQKILRYLVDNPSDEYVEKEIQNVTGISKAGVNFGLRALTEDGLVNCKKKGKFSFYSVDLNQSKIRQIKVLANLVVIDPLIKSLQDLSEKIIFFGSSATGTNIEESDIDLFILTNRPEEVKRVLSESPLSEKIQAIIKKPIEYLPLKAKDPIFYEEISEGLVTWESKK